MKLPGSLTDTFSPYLDMDPVADFFDDLAQRATTVAGTAIGVHLALFFLLQPSFIMPDLKPEEPEAIPVQIIAFEDLQAEPEPAPEVVELPPATPAPAPPPKPKPKPKPKPTPPPPTPEPEPEPEPEIVPPPPPPEILASETPEPTPEALPVPAEIIPPPEPLPEPEVVPEPIPQPIIEIFEPVPPEPVLEPVIEPVIEPEPMLDPIPEPLPEPELPPEIIIESLPPPEPEPVIEEAPFVSPDPLPTPPTPGPVIEEPLTELPDIEDLPPLPTPPQPEPVITAPPSPELIPEDEAPIITTAPTILASPEAPTNAREAEKAVPQSQSNPMNDFLFKGGKRPGGTPGSIGQPSTGLGTPSGGVPVAGGTPRSNPGASGWTLAPSGDSELGAGYKGLVLDIRCREAGKTHLDCPEYLRKFQGRNRSGWESVGAHSSPAIVSTSPRAGTGSNPAIGGSTDLWGSGPHSKRGAIGSNSVNAGGPSTSVLDDADFGREFLGTNLGGTGQDRRMRDLFKEPTEPWQEEVLTLPAPEPQDEDE